MRVGVPTEVTPDENRVAITPSGVAAFRAHGHDVIVQAGAGQGSAIPDAAYMRVGATNVETAGEVWERADLILKVKEPLGPELELMRPGQVLFTYLHLAASKVLTEQLLDRRIVGIAYETVQLEDGTLPLLVPMSEVAGRLSIQAGATSLEMISGGKGLLLPGVSGVRRGRPAERRRRRRGRRDRVRRAPLRALRRRLSGARRRPALRRPGQPRLRQFRIPVARVAHRPDRPARRS